MGSPFRNRICLLTFFLILLIHTTLGERQADIGADLCQNTYVVAVNSNVEEGLQIQVSHTSTNSTNVTLLGYYLPEECGPQYRRCNVELITPRPNRVLSFVPVTDGTNGGIAISEFRNNNEASLTYVDSFVATAGIPDSCTPTGIFYDGIRNLFTSCLNISDSVDSGYVKFLRLTFDDSENLTTASFESTSNVITIYDPETVTEILYAQRGTCFFPDHLYFIDVSYVVEVEADFSTTNPDWDDIPLDNCPPPFTRFEYLDEDELLLIQCGNEHVILYDPCDGDIVERYEIEDVGSPYPCSGRDTIAFLKNSTVTFDLSNGEHKTADLPSGSIEYGKCIGAESPIFVFQLSNGSYAVNPTDKQIVKLASSSNQSNNLFEFPVLNTDNDHVLGLLDETNLGEHNVVLANLSCANSPIVSEIPLPFQPDLVSLFPARGSHSCQCAIELPITATSEITAHFPSTTPLNKLTLYTAQSFPSTTPLIEPTRHTAQTFPSTTQTPSATPLPTHHTAQTFPSTTPVVEPTLQTARTFPSATPVIEPTAEPGRNASATVSPKPPMTTGSTENPTTEDTTIVEPPADASNSKNSDDIDYIYALLVAVVFIGAVIVVLAIKWYPYRIGRRYDDESIGVLYTESTNPSRSPSAEIPPEHMNENTPFNMIRSQMDPEQSPELSTDDEQQDDSSMNTGLTFDPDGAVQTQDAQHCRPKPPNPSNNEACIGTICAISSSMPNPPAELQSTHPSFEAAPYPVMPTLESAEGTHHFELPSDLDFYNGSFGVCVSPIQASGNGGADLEPGHGSAVPPTTIHRGNVATHLQRRTDTEEKNNDFRDKMNVV